MKIKWWTERLSLQHPFITAEHWEHVLLMVLLKYSVQICPADYSGHPVTLISSSIICTSFQNELCSEDGGPAQCVSAHRQAGAAAQKSRKKHINTAPHVR